MPHREARSQDPEELPQTCPALRKERTVAIASLIRCQSLVFIRSRSVREPNLLGSSRAEGRNGARASLAHGPWCGHSIFPRQS